MDKYVRTVRIINSTCVKRFGLRSYWSPREVIGRGYVYPRIMTPRLLQMQTSAINTAMDATRVKLLSENALFYWILFEGDNYIYEKDLKIICHNIVKYITIHNAALTHRLFKDYYF
jgi:hypothetical protein